MIEVRYSTEFGKWLEGLKDAVAYAKIVQRIRRLELGNPGNVRPVGSGVHEMKIDHGPGYRVYFMNEGPTVVILLCGGDKGTQDRDIKRAHAMVGK